METGRPPGRVGPGRGVVRAPGSGRVAPARNAGEEPVLTTIILNDAPYGIERSYNGLRLAMALARSGRPVRVFLMGDAVQCARADQVTPDGYYNVGRMIKGLVRRGSAVFT